MKIYLTTLALLAIAQILLVQSRSLEDPKRQLQIYPMLEQEYSQMPSHPDDENDSDMDDANDDDDDDKFWDDSEEDVASNHPAKNGHGLGSVPSNFWDDDDS
ncbi:uncharacterized protein LOC141856220 [Brevipalpus obovatus]|uniref:uncharacterized protein LOC141856220 n=1 Tax=Brevipalpus obovatus TaxID=246614 RepID=UPI003D9DF100